MADTPLTAGDLTASFDRLLGARQGLVLAVSGGSDSMALMHLVADWREQSGREGLPITVVTIDHMLRPESGDEAAFVALEAGKRGFAHAVLRWEGEKPSSGLQAAARETRYRLLREHAAALGADVVVTAHTADDQAETLLMRLARGSGVEGLAAIRTETRLGGGWLVRPLLALRKRELVQYLRERGLNWREDPSNQSLAFERIRIRQALPILESIGLSSEALARSATRLARSAEALDLATERAVREAGDGLSISALGFARLDWNWIGEQPEEIRLRLLGRLIANVGGLSRFAALGQLEAMTVAAGWAMPAGKNLAGVIFSSAGADRIVLVRETDRAALPCLELKRGQQQIWDGRFSVGISEDCPIEHPRVGALGAAGLAEVEQFTKRPRSFPARAAWSVPAFREGGRLIAAPLLDYYASEVDATWFSCTFMRQWPFLALGTDA